MQGISGQNGISISSGSSSVGTRASSSEPVASCFVNSFSGACNAVINRSTRHDSLSKYSSSAKAGENIKKELLKAEYKKKISEFSDNLSSDPVVSGFVKNFAGACNAVINSSTVNDRFSSPWHNERYGAHSSSKSSFTTSSKNANESRDYSSSYRGMSNNTGDKYREYSYDKPNYLSR